MKVRWEPIIQGTYITVEPILELSAYGMKSEEFAENYGVVVKDIR